MQKKEIPFNEPNSISGVPKPATSFALLNPAESDSGDDMAKLADNKTQN